VSVMWRVLCVDDDKEKAALVAEYFTTWQTGNPYGVFHATVETSFEEAIDRLTSERFDLLTLDLHGESDPIPQPENEGTKTAQKGTDVLERLKKIRFLPVIFYTGYATKIASLESLVVRVVQKGDNDLEQVRDAARTLFGSGLSRLVRRIEEDQREYIWDTIDRHSRQFSAEGGADELLYLLARRIAARLSRESLKEMLNHPLGNARPIEQYIYPVLPGKIKTGGVYVDQADRTHWIVVTPACDFAQDKAERILLVGTSELTASPQFTAWRGVNKWTPKMGQPPDKATERAFNRLRSLLANSAGERIRYLAGTFFIPDLLVDMQQIKQVSDDELQKMSPVCKLDSPYCEELLTHFSKYYGRVGTPDPEIEVILERLGH
jgi:CheY-like chemotaxis protein